MYKENKDGITPDLLPGANNDQFTCALALFISNLVKQEKFLAGMDGAFMCATIQFVFAGLPTTKTCKIQSANMNNF